MFDKCLKGPWTTVGRDVQYKLIEEDDAVTLVFQCTASKQDWHDNFRVSPYKDMPSKWYAHKGFVTKWKSARTAVFDSTLKLLDSRPLVILGYSQGGALTIMAHEDFVFNHYDPIAFTWGAPKIVWCPNKTIKARFNGLTCFRNGGDLVTHLPPVWWGYRRVGKDIRLGPRRLLSAKWHRPEEYI